MQAGRDYIFFQTGGERKADVLGVDGIEAPAVDQHIVRVVDAVKVVAEPAVHCVDGAAAVFMSAVQCVVAIAADEAIARITIHVVGTPDD